MSLSSFIDRSPKYLKVEYSNGKTWVSPYPIDAAHRAAAERDFWYKECQISWVSSPEE